MVLDTPRIGRFYLNALDGLVVDVDLGDFGLSAGERVGVHRVAMILRCDRHFSGDQILDRVIASPMPKFKLKRGSSGGVTEQLISEADSKNRALPEQAFHGIDREAETFWISGPRAEQDSVRLPTHDLVRSCGRGENDGSATSLPESAQDIEF